VGGELLSTSMNVYTRTVSVYRCHCKLTLGPLSFAVSYALFDCHLRSRTLLPCFYCPFDDPAVRRSSYCSCGQNFASFLWHQLIRVQWSSRRLCRWRHGGYCDFRLSVIWQPLFAPDRICVCAVRNFLAMSWGCTDASETRHGSRVILGLEVEKLAWK
jgi:hypothetical protein